MRKYVKHIQLVSWVLFAAFMLPQTIQIHHVLTVHHHHTHCTAKHEKHFHIASDHCPIQEYVFAVTHKIELPLQLTIVENRLHKQIIYNVIGAKSTENYYYYLRAPPGGKHETMFF